MANGRGNNMNPETVLLTIRACAEALTATMKWLSTDQGKQVIERSLQDRAAWDKFWADAGKGIQGLFSGKLIVG